MSGPKHRIGGCLGGAAIGAVVTMLAGVAIAAAASPPSADWSDVFGRRASKESVLAVGAANSTIVAVGTTSGVLGGQVRAGSVDGFIRVDASDGTVRWTRQFGSPGDDRASGVAIGRRGPIYVVGQTDGALPGQQAHGADDAFIQRWTLGGRLVWTRQFGTSESDMATAVTVDASGEVTIVGVTAGAFRRQHNAGDWDVFVRRYASSGSVLWTRQFGTATWDRLVGVVADSTGGVVVVGHTDGVLPGLRNVGGTDVFLRAYTAAGTIHWTRQIGTSENDAAAGISRGPVGGWYLAGRTGGVFRRQASAGGDDAFVMRITANGTIGWIRQFGTSENDEAGAVALGVDGEAIVAGTTSGDLAVGGGPGLADAFVRGIAEDGGLLWTIQAGTPAMDNAHGVAIDGHAGIYLGGMQDQSTPTNGNAFIRRYQA